jgi:excisionase family DNA binding protein
VSNWTRPAPPATPGDGDDGGPWLSLTEAGRLLGVSQNTVRRWADAGRLPVFTTPGGHRRFSRGRLEAFLAGNPVADRVPLADARVAILDAIARMVHEHYDPPWTERWPADMRTRIRAQGREMLERLLAHLDGPDEARPSLLDAMRATALRYGAILNDAGIPLAWTVRGFIEFQTTFMDEIETIAETRSLTPSATRRFLRDCEGDLSDVLLRVVDGYDARRSAG